MFWLIKVKFMKKVFLSFFALFLAFSLGFLPVSQVEAKGNSCVNIRVKQSKELDKVVKLNEKLAKVKESETYLKNKLTKELKKTEKSVKAKVAKLEKDAKKSCPIEERECTHPLTQFQQDMIALKLNYNTERNNIMTNSAGSFSNFNVLLFNLDQKHTFAVNELEAKRNSLASTCHYKYPTLTLPNLY